MLGLTLTQVRDSETKSTTYTQNHRHPSLSPSVGFYPKFRFASLSHMAFIYYERTHTPGLKIYIYIVQQYGSIAGTVYRDENNPKPNGIVQGHKANFACTLLSPREAK